MSSVTPSTPANNSASMAGRLKLGGPIFKKLNVEQTNRRNIDNGKNTSETMIKGNMNRDGVSEEFTRHITIDHLKIDNAGAASDLQNMFQAFQNIKIPAGDLSFDLPKQPTAPKTDDSKPNTTEKPRGAASEMPIYQMFGSEPANLTPSAMPMQNQTQAQPSAPAVTALPKQQPQGAGEKPAEADKKDAKKDEKVPDTDKNPVTVQGPENGELSKNSAAIEKITKKAAI